MRLKALFLTKYASVDSHPVSMFCAPEYKTPGVYRIDVVPEVGGCVLTKVVDGAEVRLWMPFSNCQNGEVLEEGSDLAKKIEEQAPKAQVKK